MGYPVNSPSDLEADVVFDEWVVPGGAAPAGSKTMYPPAGAIGCDIKVIQTTSSAPINLGVYGVFNAVNDTDAATRLGLPGRIMVPMNAMWPQNFANDSLSLCTRLDLKGFTTSNETVGFTVQVTWRVKG
jgi:hypothetical protein